MDPSEFTPLIAAFDPTDVVNGPGSPAGSSNQPGADGHKTIFLGVGIILIAGILWALLLRRQKPGISTTIESASRNVGQRRRSAKDKKNRRPISEEGGLPPVRKERRAQSPPYEPVD